DGLPALAFGTLAILNVSQRHGAHLPLQRVALLVGERPGGHGLVDGSRLSALDLRHAHVRDRVTYSAAAAFRHGGNRGVDRIERRAPPLTERLPVFVAWRQFSVYVTLGTIRQHFK